MRNSFSLKLSLVTASLALLAAAPSPALAAEGDLLWMQTYNSGGAEAMGDVGDGVAVDSGNNIYVTGWQATNGGDMFLRKYDSTGNFQWMQTYNSGGAQGDAGWDIIVDSGSNIYVTGWQATNGDMFLRKYDSTGNFQWMQTYNSAGGQLETGNGVAVDSGGNIYVTGGQGTNGNDMFLRKYDSSGNFQWMQTYNSGGTQWDWGEGVAVDSGGNIYVTGRQGTNGNDMFLRKYDSSGNFQWMRTYESGSSQYDEGKDVAVDSGGNVYVTGREATNSNDMFLRKYDSSGNFQWMQTYDLVNADDQGFGVAVDFGGNIYVTGWTDAGGDMFLRKYDSSGNFQWMQTYDSGINQNDSGYGIVVDTANNINIVGSQDTNGGDAVLWQYDGGGVDCGLRAFDGTATVTIDCEDPPASPLRIYKDTKTYGITVVDPADANASRIRVQTPAGIKALRKQ